MNIKVIAMPLLALSAFGCSKQESQSRTEVGTSLPRQQHVWLEVKSPSKGESSSKTRSLEEVSETELSEGLQLTRLMEIDREVSRIGESQAVSDGIKTDDGYDVRVISVAAPRKSPSSTTAPAATSTTTSVATSTPIGKPMDEGKGDAEGEESVEGDYPEDMEDSAPMPEEDDEVSDPEEDEEIADGTLESEPDTTTSDEEEPASLDEVLAKCRKAYGVAADHPFDVYEFNGRKIKKTKLDVDSEYAVIRFQAEKRIVKASLDLQNPNGRYCVDMTAEKVIKKVKITAACGAQIKSVSFDADRTKKNKIELCSDEKAGKAENTLKDLKKKQKEERKELKAEQKQAKKAAKEEQKQLEQQQKEEKKKVKAEQKQAKQAAKEEQKQLEQQQKEEMKKLKAEQKQERKEAKKKNK